MSTCTIRNSSNVGEELDRISNLPEELIQNILVRLPSIDAAARTSVLSRRWRHFWTKLPSLSFQWDFEKPGAIIAALAAYSAPTLNRLAFSAVHVLELSTVAPWLEFASRRVAGNLTLNFSAALYQRQRLELPVCEKATSINLHVKHLRLPPAGSFTALVALTIVGARIQGGDFEAVCQPRCPRLRRLAVRSATLVEATDVSVRSNSLEWLVFIVQGVGRLEVAAPKLRYFRAAAKAAGDNVPQAEPGVSDVNITSPVLEDVAWYGEFDPRRHRFTEAGHRLRKLMVMDMTTAALMRRFYIVDELVLSFGISPGIKGYKTFLNATSMIAKCEVLEVQVTTRRHAFPSAVLHLLRKSVGVAKLLIRLPRMGNKSCMEGCPCSLPDSCNTDKIQLDSLEEVEILGFRGEFNQMKFINLLLDCHAPILKKVYVRIPKDVKSINRTKNKKIRSIIDGHPEIDVEFKLWS
uniref:F-box domain-containing protein n=1 Tax=Oryza punctata TaxID=4537 RepID=A0A0E0LM05_ORYPU